MCVDHTGLLGFKIAQTDDALVRAGAGEDGIVWGHGERAETFGVGNRVNALNEF